MLNVHYVGPRGPPVVEYGGLVYRMEHKVYLSERLPEYRCDAGDGRTFVAETTPFWLFGFARAQVDCVYQGPVALPPDLLKTVVPNLIAAVREELATGKDQYVNLDKES